MGILFTTRQRSPPVSLEMDTNLHHINMRRHEMSEHSPAELTTHTQRTSRRAILRGVAGGAATALIAGGWHVVAASPHAFQGSTANPDGNGPLSIVFVFGHPDDPEAFEDHYLTTHVPMALKMPLFQRLDSCKAVADANGDPPAFYRIATMSFLSQDDMEAALTSPQGMDAFADVANFATGGVTGTIVHDLQSREREFVSPLSWDDPREP